MTDHILQDITCNYCGSTVGPMIQGAQNTTIWRGTGDNSFHCCNSIDCWDEQLEVVATVYDFCNQHLEQSFQFMNAFSPFSPFMNDMYDMNDMYHMNDMNAAPQLAPWEASDHEVFIKVRQALEKGWSGWSLVEPHVVDGIRAHVHAANLPELVSVESVILYPPFVIDPTAVQFKTNVPSLTPAGPFGPLPTFVTIRRSGQVEFTG